MLFLIYTYELPPNCLPAGTKNWLNLPRRLLIHVLQNNLLGNWLMLTLTLVALPSILQNNLRELGSCSHSHYLILFYWLLVHKHSRSFRESSWPTLWEIVIGVYYVISFPNSSNFCSFGITVVGLLLLRMTLWACYSKYSLDCQNHLLSYLANTHTNNTR